MNEGDEVKKGFFKGLGFVLALFVVLLAFFFIEEKNWIGLILLTLICSIEICQKNKKKQNKKIDEAIEKELKEK